MSEVKDRLKKFENLQIDKDVDMQIEDAATEHVQRLQKINKKIINRHAVSDNHQYLNKGLPQSYKT